MKFKQNVDDIYRWVNVTWAGHRNECAKCLSVDISKSATFPRACATGSQLLMEELTELRRPEAKQRAKDIEDWADKRGTFKTAKYKSKVANKYVEK